METQCPICHEEFVENICLPCVIPCREGHVVCFNCLNELFRTPHTFATGQACCLPCNDLNWTHIQCPICRDITHLRDNDINNVIRIPMNAGDLLTIIDRRRKLIKLFFARSNELKILGMASKQKFENFKQILNEKVKHSRKIKTAGGVTGFVGGAMFIVGSALAIPSLGASTLLMVAGGITGGAGGIISGGGGIYNLVVKKEAKEKCEERFNECYNKYLDMGNILHNIQLYESVSMLGVGGFGTRIARPLGSIPGVIRLAAIALESSKYTASSIFKAAGVAGRAVHVAGMVLVSALLIVDVITVVWNSIEIHRNDPAAFSIEIEKFQDKIQRYFIDQVDFEEHLRRFVQIRYA